jgi:hypothetical protein
MTLSKILILILLPLSLIGCATTNKNTLQDGKYGAKCHDKTSAESKLLTLNTKETTNLYQPEPSNVFSGIQSAQLNGSKLTLTLFNKNLFEEYSAPMVDTVRENTKVTHPLAVFFATIVTGGTGWIFWTKEYTEFVFGCTDKTLVSSNPDTSRQTKTGKTEWRDAETPLSRIFLISGFDKDYERDGYYQKSQNQVEIDLSTAILNTDLTKNTTIKISCLDCDLLGPEEQNIYKDVKKTVEITADFREIKATLVAKEKTRKIEQDQRDKEAIIQRVIDEKEDLQRRKETQGVPLAEFKAQCQALGFKVGSADYGNCVLELNDSK